VSNNIVPATITAIACLLLMALSFTLGRSRAGWFYLAAALSFWIGVLIHNDIIRLAGFVALSVAWWLLFEPLAPKEESHESRDSSGPSQRH